MVRERRLEFVLLLSAARIDVAIIQEHDSSLAVSAAHKEFAARLVFKTLIFALALDDCLKENIKSLS